MAATKNRRQPVDIVKSGVPSSGRDAVWQAIRKLGNFTIMEVEDLVNSAPHNVRLHSDSIKTYVKSLEIAGYLKAEKYQPGKRDREGGYIRKHWRLINDIGVDAPRLRRNGEEVTQGQARENMWRTMKVLSTFSPLDLCIQASTENCLIKLADAKDYTKHLYKAGYLVTRFKATPKSQARYSLLFSKNTGPRPPMVQRVKQVFDPNLGKVVWPVPEEGGA